MYEINENAVMCRKQGLALTAEEPHTVVMPSGTPKPAYARSKLLTEHRQGNIKAVYVSAQLRREKK